MDYDKKDRIWQLNDRFRRSGVGGSILVTPGIQAMGEGAMRTIVGEVTRFDQFDHDSDPHGEHDFGALDHAGQRIFWKIDYYGPDMMSRSENPADPEVTNRILTIMLAAEY